MSYISDLANIHKYSKLFYFSISFVTSLIFLYFTSLQYSFILPVYSSSTFIYFKPLKYSYIFHTSSIFLYSTLLQYSYILHLINVSMFLCAVMELSDCCRDLEVQSEVKKKNNQQQKLKLGPFKGLKERKMFSEGTFIKKKVQCSYVDFQITF